MPRLPRLQHPGAISHIVTWGDGHRKNFHDDGHYEHCGYRSGAGGRNVAAMLCRRWTASTFRELSGRLGLSHPDSASDLINRRKRFSSQIEPRGGEDGGID